MTSEIICHTNNNMGDKHNKICVGGFIHDCGGT